MSGMYTARVIVGPQGPPGSQGPPGLQGPPGPGGGTGLTVVHITFANSPYTPEPNTMVVVDPAGGDVVVNVPTLTLGQAVGVAHDVFGGSLVTHTITVSAPAGLDLMLPATPSTSFGSTAADFVFTGAGMNGAAYVWYNGGSTGGYLLQ